MFSQSLVRDGIPVANLRRFRTRRRNSVRPPSLLSQLLPGSFKASYTGKSFIIVTPRKDPVHCTRLPCQLAPHNTKGEPSTLHHSLIALLLHHIRLTSRHGIEDSVLERLRYIYILFQALHVKNELTIYLYRRCGPIVGPRH